MMTPLCAIASARTGLHHGLEIGEYSVEVG